MEEDLIGLVLGDAGVAGIVGRRVWWNARPQGSARPCAVLTRVASSPDYVMSGATGMASDLIQFDFQGDTSTDALAACRATLAALSGFRGASGATFFDGIFVQAERSSFDQADDASQGVHLFQVDLSIWHRPA